MSCQKTYRWAWWSTKALSANLPLKIISSFNHSVIKNNEGCGLMVKIEEYLYELCYPWIIVDTDLSS